MPKTLELIYLRSGEDAAKHSAAKPTERKAVLQEVIADPKHLVFVFAVLLYFSGFVYSYYFYKAFGLAFTSVDVPAYSVFLFAWNVFHGSSLFAVITILLGAYIVFLPRIKHLFLSEAVLILLFVAIFPLAFHCAVTAAHEAALDIRTGRISLPSLTFGLKDSVLTAYDQIPGPGRPLSDLNRSRELRLLAQNESFLFALYQHYDPAVGAVPSGYVYQIKRDDMLACRIQID